MKIYKIFLKRTNDGIIEDLKIIKDGFNFWSCLFNFFYLLYKKLWKFSFVLFVAFGLLNYLSYAGFIKIYIVFAIELSLSIYVGFECNEWISKKMIKNGYEYLGYSSGNDVREAKLKFLDAMNQDYTKDDKLDKKIF